VKQACRELGYTEQQAEDYIAEAEHGDGSAYWEYFQTYDDVKQDVHVYFDNLIDV
jgi:hypothetical protein